jgi:phosphonate degradation associated HDIG domain protein
MVERSDGFVYSQTTRDLLKLFHESGHSQYGREAVTQLEHALQAAYLAEQDHADPSLIVAALLHDVGHLLHSLPADAPDQGIDDRHEALAAAWLAEHFGLSVVEPAALHVEAKRYLAATDPNYLQLLSPPSILSLKLQGGPMTSEEARTFEAQPSFAAAIRLRRWDDTAKVAGLMTPPIEHFAQYLEVVCKEAVR